MWNVRLELGQHLSPTAMCTTEFAPACEGSSASATEPVPTTEPVPAVVSGPPQWGRRSFTGGFPGSAFTPQPDGSLLCPAHHPLYPQERRSERGGSYRRLYAARIGDCRTCEMRAQCQESPSTSKARRVSAVYWPISSSQPVPSTPQLEPSEPLPKPNDALGRFPVLWGDWPRCQIRRRWMQVVRTQTVSLTMGTATKEDQAGAPNPPIITRVQRAHWRFSWAQRLSRNARPASSPLVTFTLHGLPVAFAHAYGFELTAAS